MIVLQLIKRGLCTLLLANKQSSLVEKNWNYLKNRKTVAIFYLFHLQIP